MPAPLLDVRDVSFAYGRGARRRAVLEAVSVSVARGEVVGLLGPNGSGKSTLLRLMAGVLAPGAGQVQLEGVDVTRFERRDLARRIAVVPQETHAAFDYTALEMVLMGRYPHLGPLAFEGDADIAIARQALAATGADTLADRLFNTLSGGEKQRVVIAGALAQASDILLLDEPTTALDLRYQLEIQSVLRGLNTSRGTTLVIATHDLNLAASICDRLVLLHDGRVTAQGPTADTLSAERLRALYGIEADVAFHPKAGHLTVVPLSRHA